MDIPCLMPFSVSGTHGYHEIIKVSNKLIFELIKRKTNLGEPDLIRRKHIKEGLDWPVVGRERLLRYLTEVSRSEMSEAT